MSRAPRCEADRVYLDLVDRYQASILNYVYRLVGDAETAADLTQDTYVKAYQSLERLDLSEESEDRRRSWLYRIAHNTATDHLRRQARLRWLPLSRAADRGSGSPEPGVVRREPLRRALESLSDDQREVLHLFLEAGLSAAEVGGVLGLSAAAARKRLQRAREAFEEAYGGPEDD